MMKIKLNLNDVVEYADFTIEMRADEKDGPTLLVTSNTGETIVRVSGGTATIVSVSNN